MRYLFLVEVDTDNKDHAMQVMAERLGYDEQYEDDAGVQFDYQFGDWRYIVEPPPTPTFPGPLYRLCDDPLCPDPYAYRAPFEATDHYHFIGDLLGDDD
jgi:hypothetical protein